MSIGRPRTTPPGTCILCGVSFPRIVIVDGKRHALYNREACLECQPLGTRKRTPAQLLAKPDPRTIQFASGTVIGGWTVLQEVLREHPRRRQYLCRCKCGREKVFAAVYLRTGRPTVCTQCQAEQAEARALKQMLGRKRGDYTIIGYEGKNEWGTRLWRCRCKCGAERVYQTGQILSRGTQRVRCERCYSDELESSNRAYSISDRFWQRFIAQAARRDIKVTLTREEAQTLYEFQGRRCALSGESIHFTLLRTKFNRYTTASLDRIDPNRSYEPGNVQWVHKVINMMKGSLSQEEFLSWCLRVTGGFFDEL